MPGVSKRSLCSKLGNGHRSKNIRSGVRNIRPGEGIFQVRVQHSKVGSRFRGRLPKFEPGVEYMEVGPWGRASKMSNRASKLLQQMAPHTGAGKMAWLHSEARLFTKLLSLYLRGNTEVESKRMPPGPSQTADTYVVEIWEHGISWRWRS